MGLSAALATAGRSLEVFTAGIQVAGQNVTNANTPGYIREKLLLTPNQPVSQGGLVFGTGVFASGVVQQIDKFLETRIHNANSASAGSQAKETIYKQLESEIRELGDSDLSTSLNGFLATINDVVNQPGTESLRTIAVKGGERFAADVASLRDRIDQLRTTQTVAVDGLVLEANRMIRKINDLNPQISKIEASGLLGSEAGALRSQRYEALSRLSEVIPIRFRERKDGGIDVFTESDYLVLGGTTQQLETFSSVDRGVQIQNVRLSNTKSQIVANAGGGELKGIIEGRDSILGGFVDTLDQFASNVIYEFNQIHASGEGSANFQSVTSQNATLNATAALNATTSGFKFTPRNGSFQIKVKNTISGLTETTKIAVDLDGIGSDTTLTSLAAAINGVSNITATIATNGRLQINAGTDTEFGFANDSSGVLSVIGVNTFFTGSDSSDIAVNKIVSNDQRFFAASQGGGPSDNRNAVKLATFNTQAVTTLNGVSLDKFYQNAVASVAQSSASETAIAEGFGAFRESLNNQRQQFSGVSIDEEAIKVLEFQRSFQAAARLISTIDELFTTLLTM